MPSPAPSSDARPLGELLDAGAAWLEARGVDEAAAQCAWLAARLLRQPRLQLALQRDRRLDEGQIDALRRGIVRLGNHEPIQYVLGEWDFRGLTLAVDRRALIPRPETEQLVQLVLDQKALWEAHAPRICEVGTGSGCIVVSLAVEAPLGDYLATDCDADALSLARENAARHGVAGRITFLHAPSCAPAPPASLDAVVSNPPYIATDTCTRLPRRIRDFEPPGALDGGADGLAILRDVIHDAALRLKRQGWCFLEIGADQGPAVRALLLQAGFASAEIRRDLAGHDRLACGRMP
ncbi:MAG: peptide chain release factor N(5)-glutamine methyltransferase [Lentisphaerae bacterium]|nr:peptide chain release factor N(5)-glutamine methyltransferase [Lentisphaerota bacterium]